MNIPFIYLMGFLNQQANTTHLEDQLIYL